MKKSRGIVIIIILVTLVLVSLLIGFSSYTLLNYGEKDANKITVTKEVDLNE